MSKRTLTPLNMKSPGKDFKTWFVEHFPACEYVDEGTGIFIIRLPFVLRDGEQPRAYLFQAEGKRKYTVSDGGGIINDLNAAMSVPSDDERPMLHLKKDALAALGRQYGFRLMENGCFLADASLRQNDAVMNLMQFWCAVDGIARMWSSSASAIAKAIAASEKK